jgi:enamine deaminase RidA (YjgF/YER057c/UK114 family)
MAARREGREDRDFTCRSFRGSRGGTEHFIAVQAPPGIDLAMQLDLLERRYGQAVDSLGLSPQTAIFRRFFLSDITTQAPALEASGLVGNAESGPVAVSIVQQQPLPFSKVALLAYHIDDKAPVVKHRLSPDHLVVDKGGRSHVWSTGLCTGAGGEAEVVSSATQTRIVFDELSNVLTRHGGTLRDSCIRTWIYLKDIDIFYAGMVKSRAELFLHHGLTKDTHFIASTGIQGSCAHRHDLMMMDAYSILGLRPGQVSYVNDFDALCPTADYNVTFERGTRVSYADRSHYFISGTASIDDAGRVLYLGDVLRQLERALANVEALLRSGATDLSALMHLLVYLRDPADFLRVEAYLAERFANLPINIVVGPVCRPEWLIEVECIAIAANGDPAFPGF